MNILQRLFAKKSHPQVAGKFVLTSEQAIQTRRAQSVDPQLALAIQKECKKIPHLAGCYLLDGRKPETGEVAFIIAVTVDDEPAHMDLAAQRFQRMLQQFPAHANKTYIISSHAFGERYAGAEFYVRQAV